MSELNLEELSIEVEKLKKDNIEQNIKIRNLEEKLLRMEFEVSPKSEITHNKEIIDAPSPVADPVMKNQRVIPKPFEVKKDVADIQDVVKPTKNFWQRDSSEWEELFGGTILNRLGIIALLLALIYFFKYAFDNNWVGDTGKVALGIIFGLALLGAGEHFRKKGLHKFAYGFTGGGIASLYASIYAGYNFYNLLNVYPAFGAMILITLSAVALSLHHDSPAIASLGVLGGFLTPFFISNTQSQRSWSTYLFDLYKPNCFRYFLTQPLAPRQYIRFCFNGDNQYLLARYRLSRKRLIYYNGIRFSFI